MLQGSEINRIWGQVLVFYNRVFFPGKGSRVFFFFSSHAVTRVFLVSTLSDSVPLFRRGPIKPSDQVSTSWIPLGAKVAIWGNRPLCFPPDKGAKNNAGVNWKTGFDRRKISLFLISQNRGFQALKLEFDIFFLFFSSRFSADGKFTFQKIDSKIAYKKSYSKHTLKKSERPKSIYSLVSARIPRSGPANSNQSCEFTSFRLQFSTLDFSSFSKGITTNKSFHSTFCVSHCQATEENLL